MKCEDFGRYLDNYESLTDQEKTEMTDHAAMCEKCREELDFFLAMIGAAKSLPKIEPPADFMANLNARLDAEDKKAAPKIVYHVRRNWKQYATLAACFALVAVLTANRGILLDRIEGTEDGVITEETVSTGDNTAPNGYAEETAVPANEEASQAETYAAAETSAPVTSVASAPRASASSNRQTTNISAPSANKTSEVPAQNEAAATVQTEHEASISNGDDYGIALKGTIASIAPSETAYMPYDLTVEEVSASLRANEVISRYSLADGGESIALGRYYSIDKNGKPIMNTENNSQVAIGSLKISSADAEKAMDVLNQYPHDENGDLYTTDTENFSKILSDLNDEGVEYADHTLGGSEDIKFTIEFN